MHLEGARVTQHARKNLEGRPAHNGIFHNANALVLEHALDGIELEFDLLLAHVLRRVNEGAPHVVVTQQADFKADTARLRIA